MEAVTTIWWFSFSFFPMSSFPDAQALTQPAAHKTIFLGKQRRQQSSTVSTK